PEEIKELYLRDSQKAKIAYLTIPYEKFKVEIGITPAEIEDFYQNNKLFFEREAKVTIAYVLIEKNNPKVTNILKSLSEIKVLNKLAEMYNLPLKETGPIGISDPIEEIGWQPEITQIAFSLDKNSLTPPLETEKGILIIEKLDQQPQFTPPLSDIEAEVNDRLVLERAKTETERFSRELLEKIKTENLTNLKKIASQENITYQETGYFKFYDYIEGLGVDSRISQAVFSLQPDQVDSQLFLKETAAVIIQLKNLTDFDEKDFQKKKDNYYALIDQNKRLFKYQRFLEKIKTEANLTLDFLP
ncbi:MAG: peptidyl-prolyl cis-trans isomerase, partial [Candidatus Omnitrophica bacterium]|nr:peptidyl-prolyl cis-trans isomerase [Candidatus Omnitrophota bacterium]